LTDLQTIKEALTHQNIDALELGGIEFGELVDMPVTHHFTPGLYTREIFMPKGTLCTSKIHKTEHPYSVLSGKCQVFTVGGGVEEIEAGHFGITQPGTRRVLYIEEDCTWVTHHVLSGAEEAWRLVDGTTEEEVLELIEDRIIDRRELPGGQTANELFEAKLKLKEIGV